MGPAPVFKMWRDSGVTSTVNRLTGPISRGGSIFHQFLRLHI